MDLLVQARLKVSKLSAKPSDGRSLEALMSEPGLMVECVGACLQLR